MSLSRSIRVSSVSSVNSIPRSLSSKDSVDLDSNTNISKCSYLNLSNSSSKRLFSTHKNEYSHKNHHTYYTNKTSNTYKNNNKPKYPSGNINHTKPRTGNGVYQKEEIVVEKKPILPIDNTVRVEAYQTESLKYSFNHTNSDIKVNYDEHVELDTYEKDLVLLSQQFNTADSLKLVQNEQGEDVLSSTENAIYLSDLNDNYIFLIRGYFETFPNITGKMLLSLIHQETYGDNSLHCPEFTYEMEEALKNKVLNGNDDFFEYFINSSDSSGNPSLSRLRRDCTVTYSNDINGRDQGFGVNRVLLKPFDLVTFDSEQSSDVKDGKEMNYLFNLNNVAIRNNLIYLHQDDTHPIKKQVEKYYKEKNYKAIVDLFEQRNLHLWRSVSAHAYAINAGYDLVSPDNEQNSETENSGSHFGPIPMTDEGVAAFKVIMYNNPNSPLFTVPPHFIRHFNNASVFHMQGRKYTNQYDDLIDDAMMYGTWSGLNLPENKETCQTMMKNTKDSILAGCGSLARFKELVQENPVPKNSLPILQQPTSLPYIIANPEMCRYFATAYANEGYVDIAVELISNHLQYAFKVNNKGATRNSGGVGNKVDTMSLLHCLAYSGNTLDKGETKASSSVDLYEASVIPITNSTNSSNSDVNTDSEHSALHSNTVQSPKFTLTTSNIDTNMAFLPPSYSEYHSLQARRVWDLLRDLMITPSKQNLSNSHIRDVGHKIFRNLIFTDGVFSQIHEQVSNLNDMALKIKEHIRELNHNMNVLHGIAFMCSDSRVSGSITSEEAIELARNGVDGISAPTISNTILQSIVNSTLTTILEQNDTQTLQMDHINNINYDDIAIKLPSSLFSSKVNSQEAIDGRDGDMDSFFTYTLSDIAFHFNVEKTMIDNYLKTSLRTMVINDSISQLRAAAAVDLQITKLLMAVGREYIPLLHRYIYSCSQYNGSAVEDEVVVDILQHLNNMNALDIDILEQVQMTPNNTFNTENNFSPSSYNIYDTKSLIQHVETNETVQSYLSLHDYSVNPSNSVETGVYGILPLLPSSPTNVVHEYYRYNEIHNNYCKDLQSVDPVTLSHVLTSQPDAPLSSDNMYKFNRMVSIAQFVNMAKQCQKHDFFISLHLQVYSYLLTHYLASERVKQKLNKENSTSSSTSSSTRSSYPSEENTEAPPDSPLDSLAYKVLVSALRARVPLSFSSINTDDLKEAALSFDLDSNLEDDLGLESTENTIVEVVAPKRKISDTNSASHAFRPPYFPRLPQHVLHPKFIPKYHEVKIPVSETVRESLSLNNNLLPCSFVSSSHTSPLDMMNMGTNITDNNNHNVAFDEQHSNPTVIGSMSSDNSILKIRCNTEVIGDMVNSIVDVNNLYYFSHDYYYSIHRGGRSPLLTPSYYNQHKYKILSSHFLVNALLVCANTNNTHLARTLIGFAPGIETLLLQLSLVHHDRGSWTHMSNGTLNDFIMTRVLSSNNLLDVHDSSSVDSNSPEAIEHILSGHIETNSGKWNSPNTKKERNSLLKGHVTADGPKTITNLLSSNYSRDIGELTTTPFDLDSVLPSEHDRNSLFPNNTMMSQYNVIMTPLLSIFFISPSLQFFHRTLWPKIITMLGESPNLLLNGYQRTLRDLSHNNSVYNLSKLHLSDHTSPLVPYATTEIDNANRTVIQDLGISGVIGEYIHQSQGLPTFTYSNQYNNYNSNAAYSRMVDVHVKNNIVDTYDLSSPETHCLLTSVSSVVSPSLSLPSITENAQTSENSENSKSGSKIQDSTYISSLSIHPSSTLYPFQILRTLKSVIGEDCLTVSSRSIKDNPTINISAITKAQYTTPVDALMSFFAASSGNHVLFRPTKDLPIHMQRQLENGDVPYLASFVDFVKYGPCYNLDFSIFIDLHVKHKQKHRALGYSALLEQLQSEFTHVMSGYAKNSVDYKHFDVLFAYMYNLRVNINMYTYLDNYQHPSLSILSQPNASSDSQHKVVINHAKPFLNRTLGTDTYSFMSSMIGQDKVNMSVINGIAAHNLQSNVPTPDTSSSSSKISKREMKRREISRQKGGDVGVSLNTLYEYHRRYLDLSVQNGLNTSQKGRSPSNLSNEGENNQFSQESQINQVTSDAFGSALNSFINDRLKQNSNNNNNSLSQLLLLGADSSISHYNLDIADDILKSVVNFSYTGSLSHSPSNNDFESSETPSPSSTLPIYFDSSIANTQITSSPLNLTKSKVNEDESELTNSLSTSTTVKAQGLWSMYVSHSLSSMLSVVTPSRSALVATTKAYLLSNWSPSFIPLFNSSKPELQHLLHSDLAYRQVSTSPKLTGGHCAPYTIKLVSVYNNTRNNISNPYNRMEKTKVHSSTFHTLPYAYDNSYYNQLHYLDSTSKMLMTPIPQNSLQEQVHALQSARLIMSMLSNNHTPPTLLLNDTLQVIRTIPTNDLTPGVRSFIQQFVDTMNIINTAKYNAVLTYINHQRTTMNRDAFIKSYCIPYKKTQVDLDYLKTVGRVFVHIETWTTLASHKYNLKSNNFNDFAMKFEKCISSKKIIGVMDKLLASQFDELKQWCSTGLTSTQRSAYFTLDTSNIMSFASDENGTVGPQMVLVDFFDHDKLVNSLSHAGKPVPMSVLEHMQRIVSRLPSGYFSFTPKLDIPITSLADSLNVNDSELLLLNALDWVKSHKVPVSRFGKKIDSNLLQMMDLHKDSITSSVFLEITRKTAVSVADSEPSVAERTLSSLPLNSVYPSPLSLANHANQVMTLPNVKHDLNKQTTLDFHESLESLNEDNFGVKCLKRNDPLTISSSDIDAIVFTNSNNKLNNTLDVDDQNTKLPSLPVPSSVHIPLTAATMVYNIFNSAGASNSSIFSALYDSLPYSIVTKLFQHPSEILSLSSLKNPRIHVQGDVSSETLLKFVKHAKFTLMSQHHSSSSLPPLLLTQFASLKSQYNLSISHAHSASDPRSDVVLSLTEELVLLMTYYDNITITTTPIFTDRDIAAPVVENAVSVRNAIVDSQIVNNLNSEQNLSIYSVIEELSRKKQVFMSSRIFASSLTHNILAILNQMNVKINHQTNLSPRTSAEEITSINIGKYVTAEHLGALHAVTHSLKKSMSSTHSLSSFQNNAKIVLMMYMSILEQLTVQVTSETVKTNNAYYLQWMLTQGTEIIDICGYIQSSKSDVSILSVNTLTKFVEASVLLNDYSMLLYIANSKINISGLLDSNSTELSKLSKYTSKSSQIDLNSPLSSSLLAIQLNNLCKIDSFLPSNLDTLTSYENVPISLIESHITSETDITTLESSLLKCYSPTNDSQTSENTPNITNYPVWTYIRMLLSSKMTVDSGLHSHLTETIQHLQSLSHSSSTSPQQLRVCLSIFAKQYMNILSLSGSDVRLDLEHLTNITYDANLLKTKVSYLESASHNSKSSNTNILPYNYIDTHSNWLNDYIVLCQEAGLINEHLTSWNNLTQTTDKLPFSLSTVENECKKLVSTHSNSDNPAPSELATTLSTKIDSAINNNAIRNNMVKHIQSLHTSALSLSPSNSDISSLLMASALYPLQYYTFKFNTANGHLNCLPLSDSAKNTVYCDRLIHSTIQNSSSNENVNNDNESCDVSNNTLSLPYTSSLNDFSSLLTFFNPPESLINLDQYTSTTTDINKLPSGMKIMHDLLHHINTSYSSLNSPHNSLDHQQITQLATSVNSLISHYIPPLPVLTVENTSSKATPQQLAYANLLSHAISLSALSIIQSSLLCSTTNDMGLNHVEIIDRLYLLHHVFIRDYTNAVHACIYHSEQNPENSENSENSLLTPSTLSQYFLKKPVAKDLISSPQQLHHISHLTSHDSDCESLTLASTLNHSMTSILSQLHNYTPYQLLTLLSEPTDAANISNYTQKALNILIASKKAQKIVGEVGVNYFTHYNFLLNGETTLDSDSGDGVGEDISIPDSDIEHNVTYDINNSTTGVMLLNSLIKHNSVIEHHQQHNIDPESFIPSSVVAALPYVWDDFSDYPEIINDSVFQFSAVSSSPATDPSSNLNTTIAMILNLENQFKTSISNYTDSLGPEQIQCNITKTNINNFYEAQVNALSASIGHKHTIDNNINNMYSHVLYKLASAHRLVVGSKSDVPEYHPLTNVDNKVAHVPKSHDFSLLEYSKFTFTVPTDINPTPQFSQSILSAISVEDLYRNISNQLTPIYLPIIQSNYRTLEPELTFTTTQIVTKNVAKFKKYAFLYKPLINPSNPIDSFTSFDNSVGTLSRVTRFFQHIFLPSICNNNTQEIEIFTNATINEKFSPIRPPLVNNITANSFNDLDPVQNREVIMFMKEIKTFASDLLPTLDLYTQIPSQYTILPNISESSLDSSSKSLNTDTELNRGIYDAITNMVMGKIDQNNVTSDRKKMREYINKQKTVSLISMVRSTRPDLAKRNDLKNAYSSKHQNNPYKMSKTKNYHDSLDLIPVSSNVKDFKKSKQVKQYKL